MSGAQRSAKIAALLLIRSIQKPHFPNLFHLHLTTFINCTSTSGPASHLYSFISMSALRPVLRWRKPIGIRSGIRQYADTAVKSTAESAQQTASSVVAKTTASAQQTASNVIAKAEDTLKKG